MNISKRHQVFLLTSGIILFALLVQFLIVAPLRRQRQLLASEIRDSQTKSDVLDTQIATLLKNNERNNPLSEHELSGALLSKDRSIELITRIENLASAHSVESSILFQGDIDPKQKGIQTVPTTIRAKGTFANLLLFLRTLETEPFYITIASFRLQPATVTGATEQTLELTINATTTWK